MCGAVSKVCARAGAYRPFSWMPNSRLFISSTRTLIWLVLSRRSLSIFAFLAANDLEALRCMLATKSESTSISHIVFMPGKMSLNSQRLIFLSCQQRRREGVRGSCTGGVVQAVGISVVAHNDRACGVIERAEAEPLAERVRRNVVADDERERDHRLAPPGIRALECLRIRELCSQK